LTIEGCNDNFSPNEVNNLELSRNRAAAILNYLVNIWQIDRNRLTISARNLPENPSLKENEPDKMQENRRVELIANDFSLFAPVNLETINISSNVKNFRVKGNVFSSKELLNYTVTNSFNEEVINSLSKSNPVYNEGYSQIAEDLSSDVKSDRINNEYKILFIATDRINNLKSFKKSFPAYFYSVEDQQKRNQEKLINKYSLILFDFRKATIGNRNDKIIESIVAKTDTASEIIIEGYTDRTGRDEFNLKLSLDRAEAVKEALNFSQAKTLAANNSSYLYDNDFPEGRFYCRTVEITVIPPENESPSLLTK
jgi:outer membrane protein OmpA-like peptidoglycan-associated protein